MNVFVCYTPFQVWISRLIRMQVEEDGIRNLLVTLDSANLYRPADWPDVIASPAAVFGVGAAWQRQLQRAHGARVTLDRLREGVRGTRELRVHFSHLSEYLNNTLFFFPEKVLGDTQVTFTGIPDGILNYYPYRIGFREFGRHMGKAAIARSKGFWFRPYLGLLTGFERERVEWQYALEADRVVLPEKARQIDLTRIRRAAKGGTAWLIMGQEPYRNVLGRKTFDDLLLRQLRWVLERAAGEPVYYKPHHMAGKVEALNEANIEIVRAGEPVEELVTRLGVSRVVAFTSTGLLNLALLFGESIECIAAGYDDVFGALPDRGQAFLRTRFEQNGVVVQRLP